MRLAAPCPSPAHALAHPCAAGINTSSVLVFAENAMLDAMVAQASAGAVRALPYGIFATLVSRDTFSRKVGEVTGEGAGNIGFSHEIAAYHLYNQQLLTDPDLQLEPLTWPSVITTSEQHATWLVHAAVDAWLSVVPFTHFAQAQAVVSSRSSHRFSPDASNALDRSGRMCTLAALLLDHAQHVKSKDGLSYVEHAWRFVDHAAVCLFAVRTFHIQHPSHDRIRANFQQTFWNTLQLDRTPLPDPAGCDNYEATAGKRLADVYGHLPGFWMHRSLVVDFFEKNITKWSGQPTDQLVKVRGVKARKNLTSGKVIAQIPQNGGFFSLQQIRQSAAWPALEFLQQNKADPALLLDIAVAYEMMNSDKSPWKPLVCNFPRSYDNFLQMQSFDELERASAELAGVNPGWNATEVVERFVENVALYVEEGVAAVVVLYPELFPHGLPAKYYVHARMAKMSRTWTLNHNSAKIDFFSPASDLFNHHEPSDIVISFHQQDRAKKKGDIAVVEVVLIRNITKASEIFYSYAINTCIPRFLNNFGYSPMEARANDCVQPL